MPSSHLHTIEIQMHQIQKSKFKTPAVRHWDTNKLKVPVPAHTNMIIPIVLQEAIGQAQVLQLHQSRKRWTKRPCAPTPQAVVAEVKVLQAIKLHQCRRKGSPAPVA